MRESCFSRAFDHRYDRRVEQPVQLSVQFPKKSGSEDYLLRERERAEKIAAPMPAMSAINIANVKLCMLSIRLRPVLVYGLEPYFATSSTVSPIVMSIAPTLVSIVVLREHFRK